MRTYLLPCARTHVHMATQWDLNAVSWTGKPIQTEASSSSRSIYCLGSSDHWAIAWASTKEWELGGGGCSLAVEEQGCLFKMQHQLRKSFWHLNQKCLPTTYLIPHFLNSITYLYLSLFFFKQEIEHEAHKKGELRNKKANIWVYDINCYYLMPVVAEFESFDSLYFELRFWPAWNWVLYSFTGQIS